MTLTMFDTITPSAVPSNPQAVAGYVGGSWPDFNELVAMFPHAHHLSIAPEAFQHADCLDDEPGDATNAQVAAWFRANPKPRVSQKPVLYTSASNVQAMINTLAAAGIQRDKYFVWSAHYTYRAHICSPFACGYPQADLTQFTDHALGRNLDQSLVSDSVFVTPKPPKPPAPVQPKWQPTSEFKWCQQWDSPKTSKIARAALKVKMTAMINLLWALTHARKRVKGQLDWRYRNRGLRFHALWHRLHPAKPKIKTPGKKLILA